MSKLTDAKEILNALQVPAKQQNGMCCCVLLAMAGLTEDQMCIRDRFYRPSVWPEQQGGGAEAGGGFLCPL